jgi:hypothetical protein
MLRREPKPRAGPSTNMSALVPPWLIAPVWMPKRPLKSAERLGRQGASEMYALPRRTPSLAMRSMCGLVAR